MVLGSFVLYCGSSAVNGAASSLSPDGGMSGLVDGLLSPDDHFVEGAVASPSCVACAQGFMKLAEFDLAAGATSPTVAVGNYGEVVIYTSSPTFNECVNLATNVMFRPDANTVFGLTGSAIDYNGGRVQVNGSDMQMSLQCDSGTGSLHVVVAGVTQM